MRSRDPKSRLSTAATVLLDHDATDDRRRRALAILIDADASVVAQMPRAIEAVRMITCSRAVGATMRLRARSHLAELATAAPDAVGRAIRGAILAECREMGGGQLVLDLWNTIHVLERDRPGMLVPDILDIAVERRCAGRRFTGAFVWLIAPYAAQVPAAHQERVAHAILEAAPSFHAVDFGEESVWGRIMQSPTLLAMPSMFEALLAHARGSLFTACGLVRARPTDGALLTDLVFTTYAARVAAGHELAYVLSALADAPVVAVTSEQLAPYLSSSNAVTRDAAFRLLGRITDVTPHAAHATPGVKPTR
jgi:hypothetical protein